MPVLDWFRTLPRLEIHERIHDPRSKEPPTQAFLDDPASVMRITFKDKIMGFVLSLFIHKITLKHNRETTASNLFQA